MENFPRNQVLTCHHGSHLKIVNASYGLKFPEICVNQGPDEDSPNPTLNPTDICSESLQTKNVLSEL